MTNRCKNLTIISATAVASALVVSALYAAGPADPLPPQATSPVSSPRANLVPVPYRTVLPPAVVSHDPRMVNADKLHRLAQRPAVDLPPLADSVSPLPGEAMLAAGPAMSEKSADVSALPVATIADKPDTGRASIQTDPTIGMAQSGALVVTPPPRTTPPPAQLLTIPDPAHQTGFIPAPTAAVEDTPITTIDRPGPTTLPVTGK